jgi:signal transduction histidine kinase
VTAAVEPDGGLVVRVLDTGVGIDEDDLRRVFDPFVQADGTLERRYGGTGLGLPLAKAMVELHGGNIQITSRLGKGTAVTVRLPADRVIQVGDAAKLAAG